MNPRAVMLMASMLVSKTNRGGSSPSGPAKILYLFIATYEKNTPKAFISHPFWLHVEHLFPLERRKI